MTPIENFSLPEQADSQPALWQGESHPFAMPRMEAAETPASVSDAPAELPAPAMLATVKALAQRRFNRP